MHEHDEAYQRHLDEMTAEQDRLDALPRVNGCRAVDEAGECEGCGVTAVLYSRVAITLGYEGHPGAEYTDFHICADCLSGRRSHTHEGSN